MRINDFEQMQRNLERMKNNLDNIKHVEPNERVKKKSAKRGRRAVEKKINKIEHATISRIAKEERMIILVTIVVVAITCVFSTSIFAKTISENTTNMQEVVPEKQEEKVQNRKEENEETQENETEPILENNENAIELEEILMENVSVLKSKEYAEEIRPIPFEVQYQENPKLPEGEEVIVQEGVDGTQQVTVIKSYENNVFVSENILEAIPMENYIPQKVDKGTSKFLGNNKVHLGDMMYVTKEVVLKEKPEESSKDIYTILKSLDVRLKELENEQWCKINYDGLDGYIETKYLTSSIVTPEIVEENRRQRIKMTVNEDMILNQSTDLTLEDYKKMLTGNASDRNNIMADNAEVFYHMDKTYHLNGVFLASMAIHESGWGTSTISKDKKNLFGYGAYDRSPYESSFSFETYAEGIELVAKALVKYYINEEGTPIYEEEVAKGSYYHGATVSAVNTRYASDPNWHKKVYSYMEYLYNRL